MNRKNRLAFLLFLLVGGTLFTSTVQAFSSTETATQTTMTADSATQETLMNSSTEDSPATTRSKSDETAESSSQTSTSSSVKSPEKTIKPEKRGLVDASGLVNPRELSSYPLGVGTEFTAFAGGTLTIGQQNVTGYMGANTITGKMAGQIISAAI